MTQEEKAKAYDKALNTAREILAHTSENYLCTHLTKEDIKEMYSRFFPELAESEDEKIKKAIHIYLDWLDGRKDYQPKGDYTIKDMLAWLEKQGEQKQEINNFDVLPGLYKCVHRMFDGTPDGRLLFEVGNVYRCLSKHDRAEFEVSYGHSVYLEDPVVCKHFIPFEKQGEQKPIIDGILTATNYDKMFQNCNVPKFNVGDWVVYYRNDSSREVLQVYDIRDGRYYFTDNVHFSWSVKECDEKSHLWTIEDARDGDVLACENGWTCIFKCLNDNLFSSYCFMDHEGWFCEDGGQGHTLDNRICGEIYPATREQRDLLFQKMREAGYEWDADKKELKKISQRMISAEAKEAMYDKPACAWSEEDEKMLVDAYVMLDWYKGNNWWTARRIKDWLNSLKERIGG